MVSNGLPACEQVIDCHGLKIPLLHNSDSEPSEQCRTKFSYSKCHHRSSPPPGSLCSFETACPVLPCPSHLRQFKHWPAVPEKFFSASFPPITESCNVWNPHPSTPSHGPPRPSRPRSAVDPPFPSRNHTPGKPPATTARLYPSILSVVDSVHRALALPAEMAMFYGPPSLPPTLTSEIDLLT
ncbi:hypothetical protein CGRA01v4_12874 [Colletotrichum graminicola]|nr:hypothetical protein CGRA01v4_12874 [Colletotrichum graminicola]